MTYKDFNKSFIGSSDVSALMLVGLNEKRDFSFYPLRFGGDGSYYAYIVYDNENNVEIGSHYKLCATFKNWLRIYDDENLVYNISGATINVYRAGDWGCIIQIINNIKPLHIIYRVYDADVDMDISIFDREFENGKKLITNKFLWDMHLYDCQHHNSEDCTAYAPYREFASLDEAIQSCNINPNDKIIENECSVRNIKRANIFSEHYRYEENITVNFKVVEIIQIDEDNEENTLSTEVYGYDYLFVEKNKE